MWKASQGDLYSHFLDGLGVSYDAVAWMMLEADNVIVDSDSRDAFIAFGRTLRQLVHAHGQPMR